LSDGLTVYVRERERNGELSGILVHDNRIPAKPITLMAERGMVVASSDGPRVVMINGNRQEVERADGRLSLLHFDRYSLDLSQFTSSITGRWHEPTERFLGELFHPDPNSPGDLHYAPKLRAEGHQRLTSPLYAIAFSAIALAVLLSGEFNRRGQAARVILAVAMVVGVQSLGLGLHNLAADVPQLAALMYANALVPIALSAYALGRRPGRGRLRPLGRPFAPAR
ncbi:MAG: LptF/LptG family permease, partial [Alphaproteobacteria bacterium]